MKRVVIVGGGAAGLGTAYTLKKRGLTPVLLEAEDHVWGRLAADEGLFTRVYRWKIAVCKGPPGMFRALANTRRELAQDLPNLFLAGDYTRVPLVNGALASGISAAEEAIALLTPPRP